MTAISIDDQTEWLEADGLGGFASGTSGIRTRRYHALLLPATTPPTGRVVLVNGFDAFVETAGGTVRADDAALSAGRPAPGRRGRIESFVPEPWPTWEFEIPDGIRLRQEMFVERPGGACWVSWTLLSGDAATLHVRPFLSGRDYHAMHHENASFRFDAERCGAALTFRPYDGVPPVTVASNGDYRQDAAVVSQLSLWPGARARARRHRGSRLAGRLLVGR